MLDKIQTHSVSERKAMQEKYGIQTLPLQDLCYCTYTTADAQRSIVDVLGTDESEQVALLSSLGETGQRAIWIAHRDQNGTPGTWLWTAEQLEAAKNNPVRIKDEENDFRGEKANEQGRQVAPIHKDRRTEILMLGLQLGKSDAEVQEQLSREQLDPTLPEGYRTEQGELDLIKNWLPQGQKQRF